MAIIRATVVLTKLSGEERDAARNVWHFVTGANPPSDYIAKLGNALEDFYQAIGGRLGQSVQRQPTVTNPSRIEMATVTQGGPGAPDDVVSELFATRTLDITSGAPGTAMPAEVAIALSFRGNVEGVAEEAGVTRPRSRRRGRVFLGPLNTTVMAQNSNGEAFVEAVTRQEIANAYQTQLVAGLGAAGAPNLQHVVYSPTSGQFFPVTVAHVDNAFDTIRSRGEASTTRTEAPVNQPAI